MIALVTLHNIIKIEKWFNIILKLFKYRISNINGCRIDYKLVPI